VDPGTIWRWDQALAADGVAGLVPARPGPKGASKLTPQLVERITGLDAAGAVRSQRDWPFLIDLASQVASLIRCGQDCPVSVDVGGTHCMCR
jgi:hypothetical protein